MTPSTTPPRNGDERPPSSPRINISEVLRVSSTRVNVNQLLKRGKRDIALLSKNTIDEMINRSVRAIVDKYRAMDAWAGPVSVAHIEEETRAHFNAALHGAAPAEEATVPKVDPDGDPRRPDSFGAVPLLPGKGLEIGTANVRAAARRADTHQAIYAIQSNAFLDVHEDPFIKRALARFGIRSVPEAGKEYVIGDPALELASIFERAPRRPMKDGALDATEEEGLLALTLLLERMLGRAKQPGELCVWSVAADSVDPERDFIYHRGAVEALLWKLGYTPRPMLESHLLVQNELGEEDFTGIGLSCGAAMVNVCVAFKGVPAMAFSTTRGGDWIDRSVAAALGLPTSLVARVKEGGMDLLHPKDRVETAIALYTHNFLQHTTATMVRKLRAADQLPAFSKPIVLLCAGGMSTFPGFDELLLEELSKTDFPIPIAGVRVARNPLTAVAEGCLLAAEEEMRAMGAPSLEATPAALDRAAVGSVSQDDGTLRRLERCAGTPPPPLDPG